LATTKVFAEVIVRAIGNELTRASERSGKGEEGTTRNRLWEGTETAVQDGFAKRRDDVQTTGSAV